MKQFSRRAFSQHPRMRPFRGILGALLIAAAAPWAVGGSAQAPGSTAIAPLSPGVHRGRDPRDKLIREPGPASRSGVPEWSVPQRFKNDVFTFMRIIYHSPSGRGLSGWWRVDYPGADLNFSYRLEQLTSMKVNPNAGFVEILDERIFDYPFVLVIDPRRLYFNPQEAKVMNRYLLNGGFLMIDDFWSHRMYDHVMVELHKVFPNREPVELQLDHPIFNIVFPLDAKPQVPSEDSAHYNRGKPNQSWEYEITWESPSPSEYLAIQDDKDRIMVLMCHDTDLSDGWEEEGVSQWFFETYSERLSYPMGINIVVYALTH